MEYRASFLLDVVGAAFGTGIEFIALASVFYRFGSIGGWSLSQVALLYGLAECAFGTMDMVFSGFDPDVFSLQIRRGFLDQFLLRPLSLPLQVFGSEFVVRRLGRIGQGAAVLAVAFALSDIHWTVTKLVYLPVVYVSTVAFFGGLFVAGAAVCFWTVESIEAVNIATYGGTMMMSYPMHIYQDWIRRFFTFIIPSALMVYYPALFILDKPDPFQLPPFMPFLAPAAGLGVLAAAFTFWWAGVRHYGSTGT